MENPQKPKQTNIINTTTTTTTSRPPVWDSGSSLYDSFELKSFERQLDSAISSTRTLSMPHLTTSSYKQPQKQQPSSSKKSSKFSKSFHKLIRSLFRPKHRQNQDGFYVVYDTSSTLSTIPELPEMGTDYDRLSPEFNSLVRRTASDRFTASASVTGISCA